MERHVLGSCVLGSKKEGKSTVWYLDKNILICWSLLWSVLHTPKIITFEIKYPALIMVINTIYHICKTENMRCYAMWLFSDFLYCTFQVQKLAITVELLLGDIPDRYTFRQPSMRKTLAPYFQLTQGMKSLTFKNVSLIKSNIVLDIFRKSYWCFSQIHNAHWFRYLSSWVR